VVEQQVDVGLGEHVLDAGDHGAEEPAVDVGDDQSDPPGAAAGQAHRVG
jgi:hypothetical protein